MQKFRLPIVIICAVAVLALTTGITYARTHGRPGATTRHVRIKNAIVVTASSTDVVAMTQDGTSTVMYDISATGRTADIFLRLKPGNHIDVVALLPASPAARQPYQTVPLTALRIGRSRH